MYGHSDDSVVSATHPLAAKEKKLSREDFDTELQVVIAHRGGRPSTKSANVYSARTWRVADAHTKLQFIEAGLGWGYLPKELVESGLRVTTAETTQAGGPRGREVSHHLALSNLQTGLTARSSDEMASGLPAQLSDLTSSGGGSCASGSW